MPAKKPGKHAPETYFFGIVILLILACVIFFASGVSTQDKSQVIRMLCALCAGLIGTYIGGKIVVDGNLPGWAKTTVSASGGMALFLIVFYAWQDSARLSQKVPSESRQPPPVTDLPRADIGPLHHMLISIRPFTNLTSGVILASTNISWHGTKNPSDDQINEATVFISGTLGRWWPTSEPSLRFGLEKIVTNLVNTRFGFTNTITNLLILPENGETNSAYFVNYFWSKLPNNELLKCFPDTEYFSLIEKRHLFLPGWLALDFKQHTDYKTDMGFDPSASFSQLEVPGYRSYPIGAGILLDLYQNIRPVFRASSERIPYVLVIEGMETSESSLERLKISLSQTGNIEVYGHARLVSFCETFQIPDADVYQRTNYFRFVRRDDLIRYDELKVDVVVKVLLSSDD